MNKPWLIPTPQRAHTKSIPKSFNGTFSFTVKRDTIQNITQAKAMRMIVRPSGGTCAGSRYLDIGMLTANRILVINIRM